MAAYCLRLLCWWVERRNINWSWVFSYFVGVGGYDTGKQTGTSATVFDTSLSASAGGAGILMNSYSQIARGEYAAAWDTFNF